MWWFREEYLIGAICFVLGMIAVNLTTQDFGGVFINLVTLLLLVIMWRKL